MFILVDYDNVLKADRRLGLRLLAEKIIGRVSGTGVTIGSHVQFRLYGGWYEGPMLSRRAQELSAELQRDFPSVIVVNPVTQSSALISLELALSLHVDPGTHFHHTFRRQSPPAGVRCVDPSGLGCAHPGCPVKVVYEFLEFGGCPVPGCGKTTEQLLYRSAQKLVDTMLTVDLLTIAQHSGDPVAVVSSDDDVWPAVRGGLRLGTPIVHVHTRTGGIARNPYSQPGEAGYASTEI